MNKEYTNGPEFTPIECVGEHKYPTIFTINKKELSAVVGTLNESLLSRRIGYIGGYENDKAVERQDMFRTFNHDGEDIILINTHAVHTTFIHHFKNDQPNALDKNEFLKEYMGRAFADVYGKLSVPGDGLLQMGSTLIPPALMIARLRHLPLEVVSSVSILSGVIGISAYKELERHWVRNYTNKNWRKFAGAITYKMDNKLNL